MASILAQVVVAIVVSVHDGDTFYVKVPTWHPPFQEWKIRPELLDTPELSIPCQKPLAEQATNVARTLLPVGSKVILKHVHFDNYGGRLNAQVTLSDGRDLATVLIEQGLAVKYTGRGKKKDWCATQ